MPRKRDKPEWHTKRRSYPLYFSLGMLAEATVFCDRCETKMMGTLRDHLQLHQTLFNVVHPDSVLHMDDDTPVRMAETMTIRRPDRYADRTPSERTDR